MANRACRSPATPALGMVNCTRSSLFRIFASGISSLLNGGGCQRSVALTLPPARVRAGGRAEGRGCAQAATEADAKSESTQEATKWWDKNNHKRSNVPRNATQKRTRGKHKRRKKTSCS